MSTEGWPAHLMGGEFPNTDHPLEVHTNHAHPRRLPAFYVPEVYGNTATFTMANSRIRPMLGFKRFDSAARFCHAHDEVRHFLRLSPGNHRPAPLRWQHQLHHHKCTLLQAMLLAASSLIAFFPALTYASWAGS